MTEIEDEAGSPPRFIFNFEILTYDRNTRSV